MTGLYLPDGTYQQLVEALQNLERFDVLNKANALKIALGETADIWPEVIRDLELKRK